jgi:hypothetical protein
MDITATQELTYQPIETLPVVVLLVTTAIATTAWVFWMDSRR